MPNTTSFAEFVRNWRRERLAAPTDGDVEQFLERRGLELVELAMRNGYRSQLAEATRPYRSVTEYVRALHDAGPMESEASNGTRFPASVSTRTEVLDMVAEALTERLGRDKVSRRSDGVIIVAGTGEAFAIQALTIDAPPEANPLTFGEDLVAFIRSRS